MTAEKSADGFGPNEMWVEPTPVHEAEFERMPKRQYYGR
jgi:hypothetical protein